MRCEQRMAYMRIDLGTGPHQSGPGLNLLFGIWTCPVSWQKDRIEILAIWGRTGSVPEFIISKIDDNLGPLQFKTVRFLFFICGPSGPDRPVHTVIVQEFCVDSWDIELEVKTRHALRACYSWLQWTHTKCSRLSDSYPCAAVKSCPKSPMHQLALQRSVRKLLLS